VIAPLAPGRHPFAFDRPVFQWDARRGAGPLVVRLFGTLGARELSQLILAIRERGRSPRDLVCLDFEQVSHLDFRALPDFLRALERQRASGADVCLIGLGPYLQSLFDVAGQGPALRRLEWNPNLEETGTQHSPPLAIAKVTPRGAALRRDILR
jgi:anti-anti-sigma regulatory factor